MRKLFRIDRPLGERLRRELGRKALHTFPKNAIILDLKEVCLKLRTRVE
jgi:hypothetical protein